MKTARIRIFCAAALVLLLAAPNAVAQAADPLPSWNDGSTKQAILKFVADVTREGGPAYVPPAERIATFDNDGCLWAEQPMYFQLLFVFDRVKALAPQHPEWKQKQPFQGVLENDMKSVLVSGEHGLLEMMMATHAGMTTSEFEQIVKDWLATAKHSDLQMLQWTCLNDGARFCLYVHHTDAEREWAYDRASSIGRLDKGLDEAAARGWTVVDMKKDWKVIYPFQK